MSDVIELFRMVAMAAALWNVASCASAFWSFSTLQNASNWARAVIFITSAGILSFQTSYLFMDVPDNPTIQKLISIIIVSCGMMLGVYGQRLRIIDQFDKTDLMMKHPAPCYAIADLANVDLEAAERLATIARKYTAGAYYSEQDMKALSESARPFLGGQLDEKDKVDRDG